MIWVAQAVLVMNIETQKTQAHRSMVLGQHAAEVGCLNMPQSGLCTFDKAVSHSLASAIS